MTLTQQFLTGIVIGMIAVYMIGPKRIAAWILGIELKGE